MIASGRAVPMPIESFQNRHPRYLGLRVVRVFCYLFGILFLGLGLLSLVFGLTGSLAAWDRAAALGREGDAALASLGLWLVGLFVAVYWMAALMWFALAGVIGVLIHVEENTRATAQYVARMAVQARLRDDFDDE